MAVVLLKIIEEAHLSGELKLSGRKLKEFPKSAAKYNLSDTVIAGKQIADGHFSAECKCGRLGVRASADETKKSQRTRFCWFPLITRL